MSVGYPNLSEALKIWEEGIAFRLSQGDFSKEEEYRFHTQKVAEIASLIASKCGLDADKAYVFGLLHDYGKHIDERKTGIFHGLEGYREMLKKGYPEMAVICLSHCFPKQDFDIENYPAYSRTDLETSKQILSLLSYNDYDRLIQLSDMFPEGMNIVTIENRLQGIKKRYGLSEKELKDISENALYLKQYFSGLCGCDIYKLIGINDNL